MSLVAGEIHVDRVRGLSDRREFINLPYRLHAGTPWVPPVKAERWVFLSKPGNVYLKRSDVAFFVARRGGEVVGRISAQVDHSYNAVHATSWGFFGFLDMVDDQEVASRLLHKARTWLEERGCDRMVGPMDFTIMDESGLLVEGHDLRPMIRQPWHPAYYQDLVESAGLLKAQDLLSWHLDISDRSKLRPVLVKAAERARTRHGIVVRPMSRRHLRSELEVFGEIYNQAWARNWGFVAYDKADLDQLALDMQLVFAKDWFMVAEHQGKPIGAAITILDVNQLLAKMNGRLLPTGLLRFLLARRQINQLRVSFLGVKPEYTYTGAGAAMYLRHFDLAEKTRFKHGEAGWTLESNHSMNSSLEAMNARVVKRFRLYQQLF